MRNKETIAFKKKGICTKCRINKRMKCKGTSWCRECKRTNDIKIRREKGIQKNKNHRCKECKTRYATGQKYIVDCPKCKFKLRTQIRIAQQLKKGITNPPNAKEYTALQNKIHSNKCPCCKRLNKGRWHLHHNHDTGEWRGLICSRCNIAFGLFSDNLNTMRKAYKWFQANH